LRFGFARVVHPGMSIGAVDLDATRTQRRQVHEQVRRREPLLTLLAAAPIGIDGIWIGGDSTDPGSADVEPG
jgi:hypothetical protein